MSDGYLVSHRDVANANKKHGEDGRNYFQTIDGLPGTGKVVLCVVATIAKRHHGFLTLRRLRDLVSDCLLATERRDEILSTTDFLLLLDTLCDQGLLCKSEKNFSQAVLGDVMLTPIELKHPLQDVEMALEKELRHPFYNALRERAKDLVQGMPN